MPFVQVNQLFLQSSPLATKSKGPGSPTDFERLRAERGRSEQAEDGAGRPEVFKPAVLRGFRPFSSPGGKDQPIRCLVLGGQVSFLQGEPDSLTQYFALGQTIHPTSSMRLIPLLYVRAGKIELRW